MTKHPQSSTSVEVEPRDAAPDDGPFTRKLTVRIDRNGNATLDTREFHGPWQEAADIERSLVKAGVWLRVVEDPHVPTLARQMLALYRVCHGQVPDAGTVPRAPRRRRS